MSNELTEPEETPDIPEELAEKEEEGCVDANCTKAHRPLFHNHYSSNPSIRMRQMQAEGKVGAKFGAQGGRPKVPRASAIVAERVREEADNMARVYSDAINSADIRIAMQGTKEALDVEHRERKLEMEEQRHEKSMSRDELLTSIDQLLGDPMIELFFKKKFGISDFDYEATAVEVQELPNG